jgi:hypothetical protein
MYQSIALPTENYGDFIEKRCPAEKPSFVLTLKINFVTGKPKRFNGRGAPLPHRNAGAQPGKKHTASSRKFCAAAETLEESHGFGNQHGQCGKHD